MSIIGIDLGTTNSAVATIWMKHPEIIPNISGGRTTPSVVGIAREGGILVGHKAKHQRVTLISPPIEEVKRKMGHNIQIPFGKETRSPQQMSSYILRKLKEDTEIFLGEQVDSAVITIPAYFNESARRATREAGEMAGLHVAMIIDEPTAAALAYGIYGDKNETVLVYDLGGGTFDVSIIEIDSHHFEVLAIDGDNWLGGKDFDHTLTKYVVDEVKYRQKLDFTDNHDIISRIGVAVEMVKCDLSKRMDSAVILEAVTDELDINIDIKRELLEELIRSKIRTTLIPIERALDQANLDIDDIDQILLVGGSTRIPLVQQIVTEFFDQAPRTDINPDECVALGAAAYSTLVENLPQKVSSVPKMDAKFVVVPRTAHPLGIGVDEGGSHFSEILPAGTFYPISITRKNYFTSFPNQRGLEFWVYEGNNAIAQKNAPLGRIRMDLPENLPVGVSIWITFSLNESRILEIVVELPKYPDVKVVVTIDTTSNSEQPEVKNLQQHISQVTILQWQRLIDTVEELLVQHREKLDPTRANEITWAINTAREALTTKDTGVIESKIKILDHLHQTLKSLAKNQ